MQRFAHQHLLVRVPAQAGLQLGGVRCASGLAMPGRAHGLDLRRVQHDRLRRDRQLVQAQVQQGAERQEMQQRMAQQPAHQLAGRCQIGEVQARSWIVFG